MHETKRKHINIPTKRLTIRTPSVVITLKSLRQQRRLRNFLTATRNFPCSFPTSCCSPTCMYILGALVSLSLSLFLSLTACICIRRKSEFHCLARRDKYTDTDTHIPACARVHRMIIVMSSTQLGADFLSRELYTRAPDYLYESSIGPLQRRSARECKRFLDGK